MIYFQNIKSINDIPFTSREIDVISCIINIRGTKKIAVILDISPRTVEGHIQNILLKTSLNSQERIKDFIENSNELLLIKQRYLDLIITSAFEEQIKKLSHLFSRVKKSCVIDYEENEILEYIIKYLKLSSVEVVLKTDNELTNLGNECILRILSQDNILVLQQQPMIFQNSMFICIDEGLFHEASQKFNNINILDYTKNANPYITFFKILEILAPNINLGKYISQFNKFYNNVIKTKPDTLVRYPITIEDNIKPNFFLVTSSSFLLFFKKRRNLVLMITISLVFFLVFIIFFCYSKFNTSKRFVEISSNFSLPHRNILLKRSEIINRIDKSFVKNENIQTLVLVGEGGAGKKTLARQYAMQQDASVIWEINAETKNSLISSIEQLVYAFCNNVNEIQRLNKLLEMKNNEQKEKQLFLLVQQKLKYKADWLIIYDNVQSFKDIQPYFPHNPKAWGKGRVIITTRNANMKNNSYVKNSNVIDVGELTNDEKFQLFTSIINANLENKNLYNDDSEIRKFLENIPSFPLDVSVAAYYIKETGMPYVDYLKHIFTPTEEFTALQENILVNANEYSKTRYSIITLSIQRLIDINPDFVGLLLFISLLDSRAIPKELLVTYKGYVVVSDFINQLNRNSFIINISKDAINGRNNQKFFSIHRSTQTIIFSYLTKLLNLGSNDELLKPIINSMGNYVSNLVELEDTLKLKTLQNHCESMLIHGDHIFNERENSVIEVVLGVIFYYLGYDEKAQQKLENNLEILKKYNDSDGISVAWALLHLGGVYRKLGADYPKSIELLTNSIDIYKKRYPTNVGVALALTHLGNVYRTIGNFKQAKAALQESIKVYQENLGDRSGLAKALSSLGVVYTEQGEYEKAKDLLEQSLEIQDKYHYPKYSSVYARTLAHLGIVNRMIGNYEYAKKLLQESIDIYQCIWPKDHRDISRNIMNLGIIHSELGEYQKARKLLKKSLADYERIYGQDHIKTSRVLNYLGRCHIIGGDLDTAENLVSRALIIFRQHSHPETYVSLELLGDIYSEKTKKVRIKDGYNITFKNYRDQATDYFKQAIKVAKLYFVNNSIHIRRIEQKMKNIINQST